MTRRLLFTLGVISFAFFFAYAGVNTYRSITLGPRSDPGWAAERRAGRIVILQATPDGPASQLKPGDEVVALNGRPVIEPRQLNGWVQRSEPGTSYTLTVRREGQFITYALRLGAYPFMWSTLVRVGGIMIPALFLITGFAVFLLKPFDKQARLLAAMFATFTGVLMAGPVTDLESDFPWFVSVAMVVKLTSIFFGPVFLNFFLIFPEPLPLLKRINRLETYIYLPPLFTVFLYSLIADVLLIAAPDRAEEFNERFGFVVEAGFFLTLIYVVAGLVSLLLNYRFASLASKRRMRVVVAGSIAGFGPPLLLVVVWVIGVLLEFDFSRYAQELLWLVLIFLFAFAFFPLSFAYAIVRHQVIPVRLIIRRGVRYLLVSRGFLLIEALVALVVLSFLLTGDRIAAIDRIGARADIAVAAIATLAAVYLLRILNKKVMPVIDRRFFREAYDVQQILSELGQAVRTAHTIDQMLEMVVARIQDALHPESVRIFLLDETTGEYACAAASAARDGKVEAFRLPGAGFVVNRLRETSQPLILTPNEIRSWPSTLSDADVNGPESLAFERKTLIRARPAMLLPVIGKEQLLGIISLGPRLAELPFSREDRRMLLAVAWQMAFALENAKLIHHVAEEERLRHEILIAAEVQRRLFPEKPPEIPHLELSGVCLPARGVGGDYYDFLTLGESLTGVAVADVAGKGISAALLMSIVQASLRSKVDLVNGRLTDLVSSMNDLLHRSTGPHSFATFFYAQYDGGSRLLTYVNAGHNPPILVRGGLASYSPVLTHGLAVAAALDVKLLSTGGPVIGAFSNSHYEQEAVYMGPGDVLIAYTDGVTEALNVEGQEFGETQLLEVARRYCALPADEMSDRIVRRIQAWCGDTPQHDDLTLVILKVRQEV
jgi:sigma-B regulation protein RsbU (phosphoserine phosphatase)